MRFGWHLSELDRCFFVRKRVGFMVTEETRQKYKKTIEEFCLMDDTFMSVVFSENTKLAEMLLHIILGDDKIRVIKCSHQFEINNLIGHSSRLDLLCEDEHGKHFNVEVQRTNAGAVPQRARYYMGLIDTRYFPSGTKDYRDLSDTCVIFITEFDVLGYDLPIYHISRRIDENNALFNDGGKIVYVNAEKRYDNTQLSMLMHDFFCKNANNIKNTALANEVRRYKETETGVDKMCKLMQDLANEAAEQAAKKAAHDKSVEIAENSINEGVSISVTAKITNLPICEVEAIAERIGKKTA